MNARPRTKKDNSDFSYGWLYLPTGRARIEDLIVQSDWTRFKRPATPKIAAPVPPVFSAKPRPPTLDPAPCLPGLEHFAA